MIRYDPIFIIGIPRSGTSLVAGIISKSGAFGGKVDPGNYNNKKGFFESNEVRQYIIRPLLSLLNVNEKSYKVDDITDKAIANTEGSKFKRKFINIFEKQGIKEGQIPFCKINKMIYFWPIGHIAFPNAKWVIPKRIHQESIDSALHMKGMYLPKHDTINKINYYTNEFEKMHKAGLDISEIWSNKIISGDYSEIKQVIDHLGLVWDEDVIDDFVEPNLWKRWQNK